MSRAVEPPPGAPPDNALAVAAHLLGLFTGFLGPLGWCCISR